MSTKVAIYVRQSVKDDEGIERGLAATRALVDRHPDWTLVGEFVDNAVSASKTRKGTQWAAMLEKVEAGEIEVVVGVDVDRLLRSLRDMLTLIELKAKIITVNGEIDLTSADGEFRATMLAAIARFEIRRKSERQRRANEFRVLNGLPVAGGRRRFGFAADHVTVLEDEAAWIRHMYQRVADGGSLRSIAREMNEAGVPCVTKGSWNAPRIQKILVNPAYVGQVIHDRQAWPSMKVPVIVDPALAGRVAAIMADPARRTTPGTERRALLGGIVRCGTCQAPIITAGTKHKGQAIQTYACSAVKDGRTQGKGHPSIRRHILDKAVTSEIANAFMFGRDLIARMPSAADLTTVESQLAKLHRKKGDLLGMVGTDTGVGSADIRPQLVEIARKVDALNVKRQEIVAKDAHARMLMEMQQTIFSAGEVNWSDAVELKRALTATFESLELDMKRLLITTLLEVEVLPGRGSERVHVTHRVVQSLN